jgi:hypothetical protein
VPQVVDYLSSRKVLTTELVPGKPARFRTRLPSNVVIGWIEGLHTLLSELLDWMECGSSEVFLVSELWKKPTIKQRCSVSSPGCRVPLLIARVVTVTTAEEEVLFLGTRLSSWAQLR